MEASTIIGFIVAIAIISASMYRDKVTEREHKKKK